MTYNEFQLALAARYDLSLADRDALLGYHALTDWPNNVIATNYDKTLFRMRSYFQNGVEKQATLAPAPNRRFDTTGIFYFQLYGPARDASANLMLGNLAEAVASVFRGVSEPNGIWYRDVTIAGQPPSPDWHSVRIGGKYTFSRIG